MSKRQPEGARTDNLADYLRSDTDCLRNHRPYTQEELEKYARKLGKDTAKKVYDELRQKTTK